MVDNDDEIPGELADTADAHTGSSPTPPPLQALANRHRFPLGIGVAVVMLMFLIWSLVSLEPATVPGLFGVVQRFAFPAICVLIAAVGISWGLRMKSLWTNIAAYATLAIYLMYVLTGWIYERFIAG